MLTELNCGYMLPIWTEESLPLIRFFISSLSLLHCGKIYGIFAQPTVFSPCSSSSSFSSSSSIYYFSVCRIFLPQKGKKKINTVRVFSFHSAHNDSKQHIVSVNDAVAVSPFPSTIAHLLSFNTLCKTMGLLLPLSMVEATAESARKIWRFCCCCCCCCRFTFSSSFPFRLDFPIEWNGKTS